jgi:hypothetical protein
MGSGSLSGGGLLGQLGSSVGINSNNIGNAFIGVLIVIVLAIIVSAVYTQHRTKSKLTRAKLSSSQKSSSLSSIPTQSISALADGRELHNSSWSGVQPTSASNGGSQQRSYSLSPSDINRSALSRGLWVRGNGNKDMAGRNRPSFFWRSSSESSERSPKTPSERGNPEEALSEVLSQKSRHLSTISYSLSHGESTQTVTNIAGEYLPTSRIDPLPTCYPSTDGEYYITDGLSRHVPYSQRSRSGPSTNTQNIELKSSRIKNVNHSTQRFDPHHINHFHPNGIKSEPITTAQKSSNQRVILHNTSTRGEKVSNPLDNNFRTLQGHVGYRDGHFSI